MTFKGYKTIDPTEMANVLNQHWGFPKEGCITQFSEKSFFEFDGEFYIDYNEYTLILGEPIEIEITESE
jgi:hypothetical protein